jgi:serine/threonine protein kinase/Tol biopolymer transport system component
VMVDPVSEIGLYRVLSLLGAGTMGKVYLAEDTRLGRRVAIKVLNVDPLVLSDGMKRFEREARLASSLNHPNIVTVLDIGCEQGLPYIVTEVIEGSSLRKRMEDGPLSLGESVDVASQVASALAAAHAAGIVHRDIKPENIMLRPDGYAKVLDFGLAKLSSRRAEVTSSPESTFAQVETASGTLLGTPSYMSPEQARGLSVDERSDLFSLSVVLYEMVTAVRPFAGPTICDVIVALLTEDPPPIERHLPGAPPALQRIFTKSLAKAREERYDTAEAMQIDLASLKKSMVAGETPRQLPAPREHVVVDAGIPPARNSPRSGSASATDSAPIVKPRVGPNRYVQLGAAFLTACLMVAGVFYRRGQVPDPQAFQSMDIRRIRETANAVRNSVALSEDGRLVAYAIDEAEGRSLWIKPVAAAGETQLLPPGPANYSWLRFSRDGNHLYYVNGDVLLQVSALGGRPRRILEGVGRLMDFSPDHQRLAFMKSGSSGMTSHRKLLVAELDGSGETVVADAGPVDMISAAAWSPDGERIAFAIGPPSGGLRLWEVDLSNGRQRQLGSQVWFWIRDMDWLPDGSGLIVTALDEKPLVSQIWLVSYPEGRDVRITNDLNDYGSVSVARRRIATVQSTQASSIWIVSDGDFENAQRVLSGVWAGQLTWSPDSMLLYESLSGGNVDIWVMDSAGGHKHRVTSDANTEMYPAVSPDGSYIAFTSNRTGGFCLWKAAVDGTDEIQLTFGGTDLWPRWSPDGKWIVYSSEKSDTRRLWKVSVDGGDPELISQQSCLWPSPSPDGKYVSCSYRVDGTAWLAVISSDDGTPRYTFRLGPTVSTQAPGTDVRWSPDGMSLFYIDTRHGVSNIWSQGLAGGAPRQVTRFAAESIFSFDWTADGRKLAVSRGQTTSGVVLISNFR